jgi:hypothetical protein
VKLCFVHGELFDEIPASGAIPFNFPTLSDKFPKLHKLPWVTVHDGKPSTVDEATAEIIKSIARSPNGNPPRHNENLSCGVPVPLAKEWFAQESSKHPFAGKDLLTSQIYRDMFSEAFHASLRSQQLEKSPQLGRLHLEFPFSCTATGAVRFPTALILQLPNGRAPLRKWERLGRAELLSCGLLRAIALKTRLFPITGADDGDGHHHNTLNHLLPSSTPPVSLTCVGLVGLRHKTT